MTVQDARDVVAVVDPHELARERIPTTVLDHQLLADHARRAVEIHRDVLAVEGERRKGHALRAVRARRLDRRRVRDDLLRIGQGLLWIPELDPADLRGVLHDQEGLPQVVGREDAPDGLRFGRVPGPPPHWTVRADQGRVHFQDHPAGQAIRLRVRLDIERSAARRCPIDRGLQIRRVDVRHVFRQHAKVADAFHRVRSSRSHL